jgi:phage terminase Nu1 subunit (DNA packaging protein)
LGGDAPVHRIDGKGLCDLLELSPAMLTELKKRGIAVHIGLDAYDLAATVRAYVVHLRGTASGRGGEDQIMTLTGERARLAREQADAQALKNAVLRGELVPAAEVARAWSDTLRKVRSRLLAVPSRVRGAIPGLTGADVTLIDREVRDALQELGHADD